MKTYDYIIVGAGIAGCSVAYELSKYSSNILIIDKLSDTAQGASGAAGAFLSPLLGKPNDFKDLVTTSLKYSTKFYKENFTQYIQNCGTTRIPKDKQDQEKFKEYIPYMDFEYKKDGDGYFFPIGSAVDSYAICKGMVKDVETRFDTQIKSINYKDGIWILNDNIKAKNVILTTGKDMELLDEFYLNIRAVWGRRIDIKTSTKVDYNYHKECSVSKSTKDGIVSIGATHHREEKGVNDIEHNHDTLLKKASGILQLDDVSIVKDYVGARACSIDYMPIVGDVINGEQTLNEFPYLKNGTNVESKRFTRYDNLFIVNGVGGRGFVLGPYLAKQLVDCIINDKQIDDNLSVNRLFKRDVRRIK